MRSKVKKKLFTLHSSLFTDRSGMALVLTLMVVAIVTAAVVEFAYGVYVNTNALYNWQTSQKLSLAARSAVKMGSRIISVKDSQHEYTYPGLFVISQKIPFDDLDGTITLRLEDENAKFNLNTLGGGFPGLGSEPPYNSFVRLLKALGLKTDIADRIYYWISPKTDHRPREGKAETKNGKLDNLDELLLIPGIDRESYEKLLPYVTIYSKPSNININSASVPVLMSISDSITKDMAEEVVKYRETTPFEKNENISRDISKVAGFDNNIVMSLKGMITVRGTAFRVVSTATSGGIKRIIESVLEVSGNTRVVSYWKEM